MHTQTLVLAQISFMLLFAAMFIFEQVAQSRSNTSKRWKAIEKVTGSPFYFLAVIFVSVLAAGWNPDAVASAILEAGKMLDANGFGIFGLLLVLGWCLAYGACVIYAALMVMLLLQGGIVDIFTQKRY